MATYTRLEAVPGSVYHWMCSDDMGNLYALVGSVSPPVPAIRYVVYKYNIATDTLTDISGTNLNFYTIGFNSVSINSAGSIAWFDGGLYAVVGVDSTTIGVYKWAGTGQNWSQVDMVSMGDASRAGAAIAADSERIAWITRCSNPNSWSFRASTDGASWANQSTTYNRVEIIYYDGDRDELIGWDVSTVASKSNTIHYTSGVTWDRLNAADVTDKIRLTGTAEGYQFYQDTTTLFAGGYKLYYSADYGVNLTYTGDVTEYQGPWAKAALLGKTGVYPWYSHSAPAYIRLWDDSGLSWNSDGTVGGAAIAPIRYGDNMYVLGGSPAGIYVRDTALPSIGTKEFSVGGLRLSMDVSADDDYLHIGVVTSGNPQLLRLAADLSADPTAVFDPGSGSAIGVRCGDKHDQWVWIFGAFDGTNKLELSEDDGGTWDVADPGSWNGTARGLVLGPDDDEHVLVSSDGDDDLHETLDAGVAWETLNAGLDFDLGGADRLDVNPPEIVIGNLISAAQRVEYSPNAAGSFDDVTAGTPAAATVTILVG